MSRVQGRRNGRRPDFEDGRAAGAGRISEFGARLRQVALQNGLFAAEELVVPSDVAPWIQTACE